MTNAAGAARSAAGSAKGKGPSKGREGAQTVAERGEGRIRTLGSKAVGVGDILWQAAR